jgi:hypothetical protein
MGTVTFGQDCAMDKEMPDIYLRAHQHAYR